MAMAIPATRKTGYGNSARPAGLLQKRGDPAIVPSTTRRSQGAIDGDTGKNSPPLHNPRRDVETSSEGDLTVIQTLENNPWGLITIDK